MMLENEFNGVVPECSDWSCFASSALCVRVQFSSTPPIKYSSNGIWSTKKSKKDKSCITLEQLLERIKIWDQKYKK